MTEVLRLDAVTVRRDGTDLIRDITWTVNVGERWVVMGPNGAGKTTLLTVAAARLHPSEGSAAVLGEDLSEASVQELRIRVGLSSHALAEQIAPDEKVADVVMTAAHGLTGRQKEHYDAVDEERAAALLAAFGLQQFEAREYATLSEGERKRVQIARSLMSDPELLLLDEPAAGLDLVGREELVAVLGDLAGDDAAPVLVLVTHHVEEIPPGFTHALLMRDGEVAVAGPIADTLTADNLSDVYGIPVSLERADGRWTVRGR